MIHQKQIDKFESQVYREKVGFNIRSKNYYEDTFKKSAHEYYGLGDIFFKRCSEKFIGKPVESLIKKLKAHPEKHRSFKKAVNELIKSDLLTYSLCDINVCSYFSNSYVYVDEEGLVRKIQRFKPLSDFYWNSNYFKKYYPQYLSVASSCSFLLYEKETAKIFEYFDSDFKYILRFKGLHYYVTNTSLDLVELHWKFINKLNSNHQRQVTEALAELNLVKISVSEMEFFRNLIDIKEGASSLNKYKGDF